MASKDPAPAIQDMLEAIERIQQTVQGHTLKSYAADYRVTYVVERALEIISESSRKLPATLTRTEPHIPWKDIHGIGNILRHEYQKIQHRVIWQTVRKDLTLLREAMLNIKERQTAESTPNSRVPGVKKVAWRRR